MADIHGEADDVKPRLAVLRPSQHLLNKIDKEPTKERSYSQPCRDWPEVRPHLAILLSSGGQTQTELIWGLGIVRPAHATDEDRKVILTHARRLRTPVPVTDSAALPPAGGPVTTAEEAVWDLLRSATPDVEGEIARLLPLLDEGADWTDPGLRRRDERDALLLFAKVAGVAASASSSPVRAWDPRKPGLSYLAGLTGDAVQSMLGDNRIQLSWRSDEKPSEMLHRQFQSHRASQRYDFEVVSITSRAVADGEPGSLDAYYYHCDSQTLVVLRYLRADPNGKIAPRDLYMIRRFHDLIGPLGDRFAPSDGDYTLSNDPLFIRVHEQVPFTTTLHRTSSGAIYPYQQVMGAGTLIRHLVPTDFSRLVRDGWLGTRQVPFDIVQHAVETSVLTVGVALVILDFSRRPRANGAGATLSL